MVAVLKTFTGRPGDGQGDQEGDNRRRSLDKVGRSAGEAKGSNNRREEILVRLSNDKGKVDSGE